jgi:hypothetical protein
MLPRGGGSIKRTQVSDERQLFQTDEKQSKKKKKQKDDGDDDGMGAVVAAARSSKSCKTVSAKNVKAGTLLLGVVAETAEDSVEVHFANGLHCAVRRREKEPELDQCYAPGDYVVACVVAGKGFQVPFFFVFCFWFFLLLSGELQSRRVFAVSIGARGEGGAGPGGGGLRGR